MNRPDLTSLSDDDLALAGNRGLLKRAQKELATGLTALVEESADGSLRLAWSDGNVCEFPPGSSLRGGKCSCAAIDVCRHLIRSCLYLRDLADQHSTTAPLAPSANPTTVETPSATKPASISTESTQARDALDWSEAELTRRFGKAAVARARRHLAGGLAGEVVSTERREVEFADLGIRIRFPPGSDPAAALCSCDEPSPCSHVLPALLILRGEAPTGSSAPAKEGERETLQRLLSLLKELFRVGLDGLSPGWREAAASAVIEVRKAGLASAAELLASMSRSIDEDSRRSGRAHPGRLRWTVAALWLRVVAIGKSEDDAANDAVRSELVGESAARFWTAGKRRLVGVGLSGWWGDETAGILIHLMDDATGQVVTTGTGRPIDVAPTPAGLAASASLLGTHSARDLLGSVVECSGTRLASGGKIRLTTSANIRLLPEPADWKSLGQRFGLSDFAVLGERMAEFFPTLVTLRRPDTFLFLPKRFSRAEFSVERQQFHWPMFDERGREATLAVSYRQERAEAIAALRRLAEGAAPDFVLGRVSLHGGGLSVEPLTLGWWTDRAPRLHYVDLPEPPPKTGSPVNRSDSTEPVGDPQEVRPTKEGAVAIDPIARVLDTLADWTSRLLAVGWIGLSDSQVAELDRLEGELNATSLGQLATAARQLADCLRESRHGSREDSALPHAIGRLCVALELAAEHWEIVKASPAGHCGGSQ